MNPEAYCRERAAARGSSLHYSVLFLAPAQRSAITALYAYCREIDDVVDRTQDAGVAAAQLDWWESEIARLFAGTPQHPVTRALAPHLARYGIAREHLLLVLEGMRMDLHQSRYLDFAALARYCHLAAGVVGEMAAGIVGTRTPQTLRYAHQLGRALQLVNIVRDVGADARRGRIYLPQQDMQECGVRAADILAGREVPGFAELMLRQAERARAAFGEALRALPPDQMRAQRPGLILAAIHVELLDEIERDGFQVLRQRTALTPLRMFAIAWRTWIFGPPALGRARAAQSLAGPEAANEDACGARPASMDTPAQPRDTRGRDERHR